MASTRARLTVSYAFVLLGTIVAFGTAVLVGRRSGSKDELAVEAFGLADRVLVTIQSAQSQFKRLTFVDTTAAKEPVIRGTKELVDLLDPMAGYFMVLD